MSYEYVHKNADRVWHCIQTLTAHWKIWTATMRKLHKNTYLIPVWALHWIHPNIQEHVNIILTKPPQTERKKSLMVLMAELWICKQVISVSFAKMIPTQTKLRCHVGDTYKLSLPVEKFEQPHWENSTRIQSHFNFAKMIPT